MKRVVAILLALSIIGLNAQTKIRLGDQTMGTLPTSQGGTGGSFTPEDSANKATNTSLGTSDSLYPSQKAVKTYVDSAVSGVSPVWGSITGTLSSQTDLQSALNAKQPLDSDLTAIAGLTTDAFGRLLLTKTDAASVRTYIGAGTSSFDGAFSSLTGTPTTLSGYGITDAVPSSRTISTTAPITGGGDLSANRTFAIHVADGSHDGYLSSSDWTAFTGAVSGAGVSSFNTRTGAVTPQSGDYTASLVGLGNVTNDTQTEAAVVPNTLPSSGQILIGNAGGTAYAPATLSGSGATASLSSSGVLTLSAIANATLTNSSVTIAGNSLSLGGSLSAATLLGSLSASSGADFDWNTHKLSGVSDPTATTDAATKNYVDTQIANITGSGGTFTGVTSGCGVAWSGTGLVYNVGAGTYSINGVSYSVSATQVTLSTADGSNPRFDAIIVTTSNTADKITGTPAANPVQPTSDPATQLILTYVSVPAGATTPGNVTNTLIYDEAAGSPTEWPPTTSGSTWNTASTNNPNTGTKDTEATSVGAGAFVSYVKGSGTIDPSAQNLLIFWIRSKASWPNQKQLTINLFNASTQVGVGITFKDGTYGFTSSNTSTYQQIVIPFGTFSAGATPFNTVRFTVSGGGASIGFYLDTINIQSGTGGGGSSTNAMVWKNTWLSSTAYVKNDVVTYNQVGYVALIANGASTPTPTNANWQSFGNPIRTIGFTIDGRGSALTTGKAAGYFNCPISGKITGYSIAVDSGTATVKTWKKATGTAVPTISDIISTSGVSLSSGSYVRSTTVSDFTTTTVTQNDIFAFDLSAVATATQITFQLEVTPQ